MESHFNHLYQMSISNITLVLDWVGRLGAKEQCPGTIRVLEPHHHDFCISLLKGHKSTYEICKQTVCCGIQNQNECHMSKQKIKTNMADFDQGGHRYWKNLKILEYTGSFEKMPIFPVYT